MDKKKILYINPGFDVYENVIDFIQALIDICIYHVIIIDLFYINYDSGI